MVEELPRASPHCPCPGPQGTHPHPWALVTTGSCPVAPRGPQSLRARVPRPQWPHTFSCGVRLPHRPLKATFLLGGNKIFLDFFFIP